MATLAAFLLVLTIISAEWVEALTGWDPDGGDGSLEWLFVAVLGAIAVIFAIAGRRTWRASGSPAPAVEPHRR